MLPEPLGTIPWKAPKPTQVVFGRGLVLKGKLLPSLLHEHSHAHHVLVTDEQVYSLYGAELGCRLRASGLKVSDHVVASGEASKSLARFAQLAHEVLSSGIDRCSRVIALGGGVVGNLAGFLASTLYRGIGLIHLPTSLMAQLDASVDDKQAVNHEYGKNLIGSHYPPEAVIIDPTLLASLPMRDLRNGMAEAIKHGLTQSRTFFCALIDGPGGNLSSTGDVSFLEWVVKETVLMKLKLLKPQTKEMESAAEWILQYGHCLGHAFESATSYQLSHGEAIAIGMCATANIALLLGICGPAVVRQHHQIMEKYGLPTSIPEEIDLAAVLNYLRHDKYRSSDEVRLLVLEEVGQPYRSVECPFISLDQQAISRCLQRLSGRQFEVV